MKPKYLIPITIFILGIMGNPASATESKTGSNPLSDSMSQINQQITQVTSFVEEQISSTVDKLSDSLSDIGTDLQSAVDGAIGQLGLPDLQAIRKEISNSAGTEVNSGDLANEFDRQITRALASSTLTTEGQEQVLQKLQQTQTSVALVNQAATTAQNSVASQDVLKQIAAQNAQNASILGTLQAESTQNAIRQDLANTNLTNLSRSIDEQKSAQQQERNGAGFDTLRTSSLAGLF